MALRVPSVRPSNSNQSVLPYLDSSSEASEPAK